MENRTGREPVAWRVKDFADGRILFHTEQAARACSRQMSDARIEPLFTDLPGQGDGLRERVLEEAARLMETYPDQVLRMWDRPGGPPGNGYGPATNADRAAAIRAFSRPQASAPLAPSEEEVEAALDGWYRIPHFNESSATVREGLRSALAAAYAVRDRKPERGDSVGGPQGPSEGVRTEPSTLRSGPGVAGGEEPPTSLSASHTGNSCCRVCGHWFSDRDIDEHVASHVSPSPAPPGVESTKDWEIVDGPAWDKMPAAPGGDDLAEAVRLLEAWYSAALNGRAGPATDTAIFLAARIDAAKASQP